MDQTKEYLIEKLLKEGKITQDDAYVLRKEEKELVYLTPPLPNPFIKRYPHDPNDWIIAELDRRQKIIENCGCNPANGGSGVCGCTLTGPVIT